MSRLDEQIMHRVRAGVEIARRDAFRRWATPSLDSRGTDVGEPIVTPTRGRLDDN